MDAQKQAKLGWIAAVILLGVSLILGFLLLNGEGTLADVRAEIREDCTSGTADGERNCAHALRELQELLVEIQLNRANPDAEVDISNVQVETTPADSAPAAPAS